MFTTATRRLPHAAAALLASFAALAAPAGAAQGADRCPAAMSVPMSADGMTQAASATSCLVNAERTSRGLSALQRDADLAQAARRHSADMVKRDYFAHVTPGGETLGDRLRSAGYGRPGDGWRAGENLGWGTGDRAAPNALVDAWLASPGHRKIMLDDSYREFGIGVWSGAPKKAGSGLPGATYTLNVGTIRTG